MQANQQKNFAVSAISSDFSVEDMEKALKAMKHHDLLSYASNVNKKLDELYKVAYHRLRCEESHQAAVRPTKKAC